MRAVLLLCALGVAAFALVSVSAQSYNDPLFVLESDGKIKGRSCLRIYDEAPESYDDNYLCTVKSGDTIEQYGLEFSKQHAIPGKKCTLLSIEGSDETQNIKKSLLGIWADNFLCVPWYVFIILPSLPACLPAVPCLVFPRLSLFFSI